VESPLLKVSDLTVKFGSLVAVNAVSLDVKFGEIVGLIGPNGAGKTTLFNAITGLVKPAGGRVTFKGTNITGAPPHKICQAGMSRTFQVTRAFAHMAVEDAVRVGAYNRCGEGNVRQKVDQVVELCGLSDVRKRTCGDLGLAPLRRVELARALATQPEVLLLDEAGAGLTATELASFMDLLRQLNRDQKITLVIVEHVMQMVMGICQRLFVLESGALIASGAPAEIGRNQAVIEAYLGKRGMAA
jgi:branched-chain amino acid transport system ATP-binding protein